MPSAARNRWLTRTVRIEDFGDQVVVTPLPDDSIAAARGALKNKFASSTNLRKTARQDEASAEVRRWRFSMRTPSYARR